MTEAKNDCCPICLNEIENINCNCLTTECGHMFHTNCLLKHTSINGYGCPCCRNQMVENGCCLDETENNDILSDIESIETIETIETIESIETIEENDYYMISTPDEQYILDGMRWLFQQAQGEPVDSLSPFTDEFEQWHRQIQQQQISQKEHIDRVAHLVLDKLSKTGALTYNDLVYASLFRISDHFSYSSYAYQYDLKVRRTLDSMLQRTNVTT